MYCLVMVACGNMKLFRTTFEKKDFLFGDVDFGA